MFNKTVIKQTHCAHFVSCRKSGDSCRFNYPKSLSDRTLLSKSDKGSKHCASVSTRN